MKLRKVLSLFVALVMMFEVLPLSSLATEIADATENVEVAAEAVEEETETEEAEEIVEEAVEEGETVLLGTSADEAGIVTVSEDEEVTVVDSGECGIYGDNVIWSLTTDGVLTISGEGWMDSTYSDATSNYAPWYCYVSSITSVVIESGVTLIGGYAFYGCYNLTDVTISDSVIEIMDAAFKDCSSLVSICIPNSVTFIGNWAFLGCTSLANASLPEGLTATSGSLFEGCTSLAEINLPDGLVDIGMDTFRNCSSLTSIVLPESIVTIGKWAFYGCSSLTSIDLPESITTIEQGTFYGCYNLADVTILDGVVTIGANAFCDCTNLTRIIIPDSVTTIESYAFAGCTSLKNIVLSENLNAIKSSTFRNCISLTNIRIPSSVISIGDEAFYKCTNLVSVTIEDGVNAIGNYAFNNCTSLRNISIPDSVTTIGSSAFEKCSNLTNVKISKNLVVIPKRMFFSCSNLASITIPNSVTEVGDWAFWECTNLSSITILSGVTTIGDIAFGNNAVTSVTIPDSVITIGSYSFQQCLTLSSITIPNSVTKLGDWAFSNCTSLADIYYAGTVSEWKKIEYNTPICIEGVSIHCSDGVVAYSSSAGDYVYGDPYIIEQVSKYTDNGLYAQYIAIMNSDDSWSTKYQKWTELFTTYGFLDTREGIQYLSSVSSERRAYLTLTNNEMYTCYLYYDWLNNTPRGTTTKLLMIADGLIFNNELSTWLDPLTYVVGGTELPGIEKYKDMLYEFMDAMALDTEITTTISSITKLANNVTSATKLKANNLIYQLNHCDSIEEVEVLLEKNENGVISDIFQDFGRNTDGELEFTLAEDSGFGKFAKAMGYANRFITGYVTTVNDLLDLITLDNKLAVYAEYVGFLDEVKYSTDLPLAMRYAAALIRSEIESGEWGVIYNIGLDIFEATQLTSQLKKEVLQGILGKAGYASISEVLLVVNLTSYCINKVIDIGAIVKGTAYIEGYAYLSLHYCKKLEQSKNNFLISPNADNAWDFFENYNILYLLRYKGEQAVLNMYKFDGIAGEYLSELADYAYKEEVVSNVLETLEGCRFNIASEVEIPESVQYSYKAVISCPVDVEVYAPDGTYITTLYDGVESDLTNEYGRFVVVYRDYTGTYAKVVCLYQEGDYTFKTIGTDEGLVNFEMASSTEDSSTEYIFTNEEISEGTIFIFSTETVVNDNTYDVDSNGDDVVDYQSEVAIVTGDSYLAVESVSLDVDAIELDVDDSYLLSVTIAPSDATRKNVIWVSSDSSVAEITTGKIEAKSVGTATISCISQDNAELIATCKVNVIDSSELVAETQTTLSSTDWTLAQSDVESATGDTTTDKISALIDTILAGLGIDSNVTVTYTITDITEAIAGDATDVGGTDGSFTINFTISAGDESDTLTETGTIIATAYVHTHSLTRVEAVDATCTAEGNIEYWHCSVCGKYYSDEYATNEITLEDTITPKIAHSYEAVVTNPTCTEDGYTTYTCSACGDSYVVDETEAIGHSYEAVVTNPTCTEGGYTTYTCSVCGDSYVADETEAIGHSYEAVVTNPTCTEGGYTTYTCSACGDSYVADEKEALGHSYDVVVTEPTCTDGGYTTHTCSVCGDSYTDSETEALGHDYTSEVTKEATCTEAGVMTYTCSRCGDSYTEDIDMIAHTYGEPEWTWIWSETEQTYTVTAKFTCTVCGGIDTETALVTSETTNATCIATGSIVYTAVVDMNGTSYSYTKTVELPIVSHTEGEAVVENEVKATCTTGGSYDKVVRCTVCNEELSRETITVSATGHSTEIQNAKDATCTEDGYTGDEVCTVCGETITVGTVIPAIGHSFNSEGECSVCGTKTGEYGITSTVKISSGDIIFANVLPSSLVTSVTISISNDNGGTLVVSKIVEDSAYPYLVEHIADTLSFTLYSEAQGDDLISDTNSFTITTTENNKKVLKKATILFYGDIDYSGTGTSTVTMDFASASDLSSSDIYVLHYTGSYPTWEVVASTVTFGETLTVEFEASDYSPFVVLSVASASSGGSSSMIDILLKISANYSAVTEAIDRANALNPSDYENFSAVTEAINAVNWNLKAINQLTVNAYADAINTAIDNLVETTANIAEETVEIIDPIEGTDTDTEEDDESPETSEPETNPTTGIAFSILPMVIAALAAASAKRR